MMLGYIGDYILNFSDLSPSVTAGPASCVEQPGKSTTFSPDGLYSLVIARAHALSFAPILAFSSNKATMINMHALPPHTSFHPFVN